MRALMRHVDRARAWGSIAYEACGALCRMAFDSGDRYAEAERLKRECSAPARMHDLEQRRELRDLQRRGIL